MAESMGLIPVKTAQEVIEQKALRDQAAVGNDALPKTDASSSEIEHNLAGFIRNKWMEAKRSKFIVEEQMLKNLRQIDGIYEPDMLAAINAADVPLYFMMLTDAKCRAAKAWIQDVLCQPSYKPWDIEPTPDPDLPPDVTRAIQEQFVQKMFATIVDSVISQQGKIDPIAILQTIKKMVPKFQEMMKEALVNESKERTDEIKIEVDDHLTEGAWYEAIENFVADIVKLKCGIIKGPVMRLEPTIHLEESEDGKHKVVVKDDFVWKYERRSPFHIFPQPNSTGPQDGYLIDLIRVKKKELQALRELPGYHKDEINEVLERWKTGGLREWTYFDPEKQQIEKKTTMDLYLGENIDCLEYWGECQGQLLLDWGIDPKEIDDPLAEYPISAWLIEKYVIKAQLNYDPMKEKPYRRVCYEEIEDNFWGKGLPEIIVDIQRACNASCRAIMHNLAVGSGPMVEVNKDRLAPGESTKIWPYRIFLTTNDQMETSKAVNFYAPPMVVERLISCYKFFSNLADEYCGIPAYSHGDPQVGGAGNTASGLSMLITQAARGIKGIIKMIDSRVIVPDVKAAYYKVIENFRFYGIIPDHKIVAQGAISLLAKEQQAQSRIQALQMTNNPTDVAIMGPDGRRYLLRTVARSLELDENKMVPEGNGMQGMGFPGQPAQPGQMPVPPGQPGQAMPTPPGPPNLDQAGNPGQGVTTRQFNQR